MRIKMCGEKFRPSDLLKMGETMGGEWFGLYFSAVSSLKVVIDRNDWGTLDDWEIELDGNDIPSRAFGDFLGPTLYWKNDEWNNQINGVVCGIDLDNLAADREAASIDKSDLFDFYHDNWDKLIEALKTK